MGATTSADTEVQARGHLTNVKSGMGIFCCQPGAPAARVNEVPILPINFSQLGSARSKDQQKQQQDSEIEAPSSESQQPSVAGLLNECEQQTYANLKQNDRKVETAAASTTSQWHRRGQATELKVPQNSEGYVPISVPYAVIKLMIKPEILKVVRRLIPRFEQQNGSVSSETFFTWKLMQQGFYANKRTDGTTIIITEDLFYQGQTKVQTFVPEGSGLLITTSSFYRGGFLEGRAHGKGEYMSHDGQKKCNGAWADGLMKKGKIKTKDYCYQGELEKGIPDGRGTLKTQTGVEYIGLFKEGLFQDKEGKYSCPEYKYVGGFKNGKKNGKGTLIKTKKDSRKKDVQLKGIWQDDKIEVSE